MRSASVCWNALRRAPMAARTGGERSGRTAGNAEDTSGGVPAGSVFVI